jgi:hypothetical protein
VAPGGVGVARLALLARVVVAMAVRVARKVRAVDGDIPAEVGMLGPESGDQVVQAGEKRGAVLAKLD